jgi:hypothetical protein
LIATFLQAVSLAIGFGCAVNIRESVRLLRALSNTSTASRSPPEKAIVDRAKGLIAAGLKKHEVFFAEYWRDAAEIEDSESFYKF